MKCLLLLLLPFGVVGSIHAESGRMVRTWTDTTGRTLQAALLGFDSGQVALQFPDGKITRLQASQLSESDRDFIGRHIAEVFDPITGKAVPMSGAVKLEEMSFTAGRRWPSKFIAPDSLTLARPAGVKLDPRRYLYRTRRFEYALFSGAPMDSSTMKEIARVFEGTYELLRSSPWGIQAQPQEGLFRAEVYTSFNDYHSAGGPAGSSGVYFVNGRVFKLPIQSLGLMLPPGLSKPKHALFRDEHTHPRNDAHDDA